MTTRVSIHTGVLPEDLLAAVEALAAQAQRTDGAPAFSDQTLALLQQARTADPGLLLATTWYSGPTATEPASPTPELTGVAAVALDEHGPQVAEIVVHPDHRQRGLATELATALLDRPEANSPEANRDTGLRAWAHGNHPGAAPLAQHFSWNPVRELWVMHLDNPSQLPAAELPEAMRLRSFVPGQDEQAWLRINAAAFADHPEQGRLTLADLDSRMAEPWFDPAGLLLAEDENTGELTGFHWTKIHPPAENSEHDDARVGEVYVVGISPAAQGKGLGAALTIAGIDYLRSQGIEQIILYVDASNTPAVKLYQKLGFTVWKADTQYAPATDPATGTPG